jgi:transcriptional regulator with PAS, ATPase and Fis domain
MVILSENGVPDPASLPGKEIQIPSSMNESVTLEEMEEKMIRAALARNANNLTATSSVLGISRQTLYSKIKKYGI